MGVNIVLPLEVFEFYQQNGTKIPIGDRTFYFIPFWLEDSPNGTILHSLENLPNDLRYTIKFLKGTEKSNKQEWEAIPIEEFTPTPAMIYPMLVDSRIPMMAQYISSATEQYWVSIPEIRKISKGLTHILMPKKSNNYD